MMAKRIMSFKAFLKATGFKAPQERVRLRAKLEEPSNGNEEVEGPPFIQLQ